MTLAVVLPLARTQFFGNDGLPLALGTVAYYIPGTNTDKDTWEDPQQATLNTNPVELDASGCAFIYGAGAYRMVVTAANGVQVFDGPTEGVLATSGEATGGFGPRENIAAAATIQLGDIASHNALVIGATGIGSFGNTASLDAPMYYVEFDNGLTLTDSSALQLPGGEDLILGVGDALLAEYLDGGNWKVIEVFWKKGLSTGFGTETTLLGEATTQLGSSLTNLVKITGNTGISSFGNTATLARPIYLVRFTGTPTLTNGANLALPTSADIVVRANDSLMAEYLGAGAWRVLSYTRADGYPLVERDPQQRAHFISALGAFDITLAAEVDATTRIKFTVQGGGGGAGGSNAGNTNGGSGGGAGGYYEGYLYGFTGGQHITGVIGAGGAGGTDTAGSNGVDTTVIYGGITIITASKGTGGARSGGAAGTGGATAKNLSGGLSLEAEIATTGGNGQAGGYAGSNVNWSGAGGSSPVGTGAPTTLSVSGGVGLAGVTAPNWGAGGSGSVGAAGLTGGAGSQGFVKIEYLVQVQG